jgi:hypothetical protein
MLGRLSAQRVPATHHQGEPSRLAAARIAQRRNVRLDSGGITVSGAMAAAAELSSRTAELGASVHILEQIRVSR